MVAEWPQDAEAWRALRKAALAAGDVSVASMARKRVRLLRSGVAGLAVVGAVSLVLVGAAVAVGPAVTVKRWRTWRAKRVAFVDWQGGHGVTVGRRFDLPPCAGLGDFLVGLPPEVERVYIVGPRVGGDADGLRDWLGAPVEGWSTDPAGHYLEDLQSFTLRYRSDLGRRVDLHRAASWFGEGAYTPAQAEAAWDELAAAVSASFGGGTLLATPATTGRDLFVRGLGERSYPRAPLELQDEIRGTTGQGRDELLPAPAGVDSLAGLAEYDGRLMYGALCWGLGSGVEVDQAATNGAHCAAFAAEFAANPQRRGRYLVRWKVPADWDHVGLVGHWTGNGWRYPSAPGESGVDWLDGCELVLLMRCRWGMQIQRRVLYYEPTGAGPLDSWAKKLCRLRDDVGELAGAGVRSILLHSIGAFTGRGHTVTRSAPIDRPGAVPADAIGTRIEGDWLVWGEPRPTAWPELAHPEWSAAVWARCRARLWSGPDGTGALYVPASSVVAFRTDALYLTERQPWPDDGRVGRLRLKSWLPGPLPWPESKSALLRMRDSARRG